jgi:hypothetical protein
MKIEEILCTIVGIAAILGFCFWCFLLGYIEEFWFKNKER